MFRPNFIPNKHARALRINVNLMCKNLNVLYFVKFMFSDEKASRGERKASLLPGLNSYPYRDISLSYMYIHGRL